MPRTLSLAAINEEAVRRRYDLEDIPWHLGVDRSRHFGPECMSHLYYCPSYALLTAEERRYYNQVHAMGVCEQFIFLEEVLLIDGLERLMAAMGRRLDPALGEAIRTFVEEERKHSAMFERLLRLADPEVYATRRFSIYLLSPLARGFIRASLWFPHTLLWWLWTAVLFEEKTLDFYRKYTSCPDLPAVDPLFVAVHRFHAMDEARHLVLDHHLVDLLWPGSPAWKRSLNVAIFAAVMNSFTHPRRTVRHAVDRLVARFPRLEPTRPRLAAELSRIHDEPRWHEAFYSRRALPQSFALLDRFPEMAPLARVFPLWTPADPAAAARTP